MDLISIYRKLVSRKWILGIINIKDNLLDIDYSNVKINWVKDTNTKSWYADPFIISDTNDTIIVLVEEFLYSNQKGRITRLEIDKSTYKIIKKIPILDLDTHLSFPAYYIDSKIIYLYPENSASGNLTFYKYNIERNEIDPVYTFNKPLTDATIYKIDSDLFMFTTQIPYDNRNKLDIYKFNKNTTNFELYQTFSFEENIARNAGLIFNINGKLYRPSQINNNSYGEGVCIQGIKYINGEFDFYNLKQIYSPNKRYNLAFHTFNVYQNRLLIVDAQGYNYPIIANIINILKKISKL